MDVLSIPYQNIPYSKIDLFFSNLFMILYYKIPAIITRPSLMTLKTSLSSIAPSKNKLVNASSELKWLKNTLTKELIQKP